MITEQEITKNKDVPAAYRADLEKLLIAANIIRAAYNKPLIVTSGYRTWDDHVRIYKEKAQKRGMPFYLSQVPTKSNHLYCRALDFADANGDLKKWILNNIDLLEKHNIYCEDFDYTKTWVHIQIVAPASENRFFKP